VRTGEYVQKVKFLLLEDMKSDGDVSPNGMETIVHTSKQYRGSVPEDIIAHIIVVARWIEEYFTHCRHLNRPIDYALVTGVLNTMDVY